MPIFKKKGKTIPQNKYRIVKIGKDAIYEILREYIIDNQENFFDVTDGTKIVTHFDINWDTGEFICIARNEYGEDEHLQSNIDTTKILSKLQDTTETVFEDKRYIELSEEEIKNL
ncbi:MAG: hypothetical protein IKJ50_04075 [Clostridia bacterium]|nr:hypothetical protein [Clostridia bacterium]